MQRLVARCGPREPCSRFIDRVDVEQRKHHVRVGHPPVPRDRCFMGTGPFAQNLRGRPESVGRLRVPARIEVRVRP